ncbi:molybdenum ABC transporter ATP-binding protein [Pleionea sp. CnH1-48]|uniref:molybdenum ABC transporter ATP-binding protein n=1 Tax=Pleionea sp. CnH1-48 TaxID=2954494 RepID=UPI002096B541|nr:molybdenum ABC transporter ATP-binding protein [Pleionea sp. CnH1-48]MCO7224934.1 molybdenum ABC transporter ATP-binding protein [Pleionea sp. CnH1-48]
MTNPMSLELRLSHSVDDFHLNLDVKLPGQGVTAVFGHSGCGKTTLLRCVAGLEKANEAFIKVNDKVWQGAASFCHTHQRSLGFVFQEASLFSHLTVEANLMYAIKRAPRSTEPSLYRSILELLGLDALIKRMPDQLSGGERQRVAIARALLIQPDLLLMDEPLAALDFARKDEVLPYLERMKKELAIPMLYVTHSMDEVARLADHLIVMEQGKVLASGALTDVFSRLDLPLYQRDESGVVLTGEIESKDEQWHLAKVGMGGYHLWVQDLDYAIGQSVRLRVLARDVSLALSEQTDSSFLNVLSGVVDELHSAEHPSLILVRVKVAEGLIIARITQRSMRHLKLAVGSRVWLQIKSVALIQ